ncbi:HAD family hydrolase [Paracoccus pacificus]|uniref:HAD family hydrolase n=1 Tax=Paracoccus pacificus TaxID=1463598 RepID=A0ABW4RDU5_9RHOB
MSRITTIGFDADDTLWENERFFRNSEAHLADLLADHLPVAATTERLYQIEARNLAVYGYGIKGFTLSMIETALEVTGGRADPALIARILQIGRDMLAHPVDTLPDAGQVLEMLAGRYRLVLITKGDLFDQERKLAASGLGDHFDAVEIVADKRPDTYARIFTRHGDGPERAAMVGNSLKSDVLPAIAAGGWGVFVPHALTWSHEHAEEPEPGAERFARIDRLADLPPLIGAIG